MIVSGIGKNSSADISERAWLRFPRTVFSFRQNAYRFLRTANSRRPVFTDGHRGGRRGRARHSVRAVVVNPNTFVATGGGQRTDRPTHPNGIESFSPRLRGRATLGNRPANFSTRNGLDQRTAKQMKPRWGKNHFGIITRRRCWRTNAGLNDEIPLGFSSTTLFADDVMSLLTELDSFPWLVLQRFQSYGLRRLRALRATKIQTSKSKKSKFFD